MLPPIGHFAYLSCRIPGFALARLLREFCVMRSCSVVLSVAVCNGRPASHVLRINYLQSCSTKVRAPSSAAGGLLPRVRSRTLTRRTPCSWIQLEKQQLAGDAAVHERGSALWFEANRLLRRAGSGQDGGLPAAEFLLQGVAHFLIQPHDIALATTNAFAIRQVDYEDAGWRGRLRILEAARVESHVPLDTRIQRTLLRHRHVGSVDI